MRIFIFLLFLSPSLYSQTFEKSEITKWERRSKRITIIRDTWGIPHIYGSSDADAVFGMLYAQCEDDFKRVERNYLDALGKMSEAYGSEYLYHDLRARMFMNEEKAKDYYENSPEWMQELCDAFAGGINYFIHTHPEVKPDLLTRFEPWMPFYFSEGSIGGDITRIPLKGMKAFYGMNGIGFIPARQAIDEPNTGSNGFAISPHKSQSGHALLLINPHTSYYFRSEMQVNSRDGLKAYGAVTWGQFFIYQGFNDKCGWMHTSTHADAIDEYLETITWKDEKPYYSYGKDLRPVEEINVSITYREGDQTKQREFTYYQTHHGPVIRKEGENWVTFRMMNRPLDALRQSFLRTKAQGYKDFKKTMEIRTNSSNNTVYADAEGNIAYWHGNFIPKRNSKYDYSGLIDGSNPDTDWDGLLGLKKTVQIKNPKSGWIQNCNSTPFTAAGPNSPKKSDYATYLAPDLENYRGINAVRVLSREPSFNLEKLKEAANDPYLSAFEKLIPHLVSSYNRVGDTLDLELKAVIDTLKSWDFNYGEESVQTTLAVYWAEKLLPLARFRSNPEEQKELMMHEYMLKRTRNKEKVAKLKEAIEQLKEDFGTWKTPWGEVNRFQRLTGQITEVYDDDKASIPIGYASSRWGSLASASARSYPNTKRRYGRGGNSFVAVVEFGEKVKAQSIVSGGQNSDPESPHFVDQAEMFCKGQFKDVYFYRGDVMKNSEKTYHPGEKDE